MNSNKDTEETRPHLVIPYTLDCNDMRFSSPTGFSQGDEFFQYLKDNFDCLYAEGEAKPKMMSIGLHCRIIGKPSRFMALKRFIDYVQSHDKVWITKREDIAKHWYENHPPS
ncbi:urate oxidase [Vibrio ishigakensis]|uniref:Urate oxidase n=1 Tax=Vibrio ishigakensis TaxID=1481914 RepID=A0A0B8PI51_9VIBR|nr:urate oxidase [Vibrio ishigakensis]